MKQYVLVIGAHPDDELLGSGGTFKKFEENGYEVISAITALGKVQGMTIGISYAEAFEIIRRTW